MNVKNIKVVTLIFFYLSLIIIVCFGVNFLKQKGKKEINTGNRINRLTTKFFDYNNVIVKVKDDLVLSKVKIIQSIQTDDNVIFVNSGQTKNMKNFYGRNTFNVFYKNNSIGYVSFFKKNNWHTDNLTFHLFKSSLGDIDFTLEVEGRDSKAEKNYTRSVAIELRQDVY